MSEPAISMLKGGIMEGLLSRKEAAAHLGVSVSTLDRIIRSGQIAYIQRIPGGKVWISTDAIREYIARMTKPAMPAAVIKGTYRKRRANARA